MTVQACINAAPAWPVVKGRGPGRHVRRRWVSKDSKDSFYTVLNEINNARYQYFEQDGVPADILIQHHPDDHSTNSRTSSSPRPKVRLWGRYDAPVGGTQASARSSTTRPRPWSDHSRPLLTYGVLNYTACSSKRILSSCNEWMKDEHGTRYGFAGNYSSHSISITTSSRVDPDSPEFGYYRNYNNPAFDNGTRKDMYMGGFDDHSLLRSRRTNFDIVFWQTHVHKKESRHDRERVACLQ